LRRVTAFQDVASLDLNELEGIARAFRGGFLEDLSLPKCPEFEAWRISHVDDVELLKAGILRTLIARLEREPSRALPYAHALLAMHPEDRTLAAAVRALAERAHEQAVTLPAWEVPERGPSMPPSGPTPIPARSSTSDNRPSDTGAERKNVTVLSVEIVSPLLAFASVDPETVVRHIDPLFESTFSI
jgi:hypothetical protein